MILERNDIIVYASQRRLGNALHGYKMCQAYSGFT